MNLLGRLINCCNYFVRTEVFLHSSPDYLDPFITFVLYINSENYRDAPRSSQSYPP